MDAVTTIPPALAAIFPLIATAIARRETGLALWARIIIAILVSLAGAVCCVLSVYALTPGNIAAIIWSIIIYMAVLASGPLKPLYNLVGPQVQALRRNTPWSAYEIEDDIEEQPTRPHPAYADSTPPPGVPGAPDDPDV